MHDKRAETYLSAQVSAGSGRGKNPGAPAPLQGIHVKSEAQDPGDFNQLSPSNL